MRAAMSTGYFGTLEIGGMSIPIQKWNCRCTFSFKDPPRTEINDLGSKMAALAILSCDHRKVIVPSREEWIGVNLLERDDELPPRKKYE